MSAKTITIDGPTRKAIVVGVAALCLCVAGALLVVGRGSGGTSFAALARSAQGPSQAPANGGWAPRGNGAPGVDGRDGAGGSGSIDEFRRCLEDQGVTLPDPGGQAHRPVPTDELRQALEACRQYLPGRPSGAPGFGAPGVGSVPFGTPPANGAGGRGTGDSAF